VLGAAAISTLTSWWLARPLTPARIIRSATSLATRTPPGS